MIQTYTCLYPIQQMIKIHHSVSHSLPSRGQVPGWPHVWMLVCPWLPVPGPEPPSRSWFYFGWFSFLCWFPPNTLFREPPRTADATASQGAIGNPRAGVKKREPLGRMFVKILRTQTMRHNFWQFLGILGRLIAHSSGTSGVFR